jgi:hypothetical protein
MAFIFRIEEKAKKETSVNAGGELSTDCTESQPRRQNSFVTTALRISHPIPFSLNDPSFWVVQPCTAV